MAASTPASGSPRPRLVSPFSSSCIACLSCSGFVGIAKLDRWSLTRKVLYVLNELLVQYNKDTEITNLVNSLDIFIVPVFNVDGYVYTYVLHPGRVFSAVCVCQNSPYPGSTTP